MIVSRHLIKILSIKLKKYLSLQKSYLKKNIDYIEKIVYYHTIPNLKLNVKNKIYLMSYISELSNIYLVICSIRE